MNLCQMLAPHPESIDYSGLSYYLYTKMPHWYAYMMATFGEQRTSDIIAGMGTMLGLIWNNGVPDDMDDILRPVPNN